MQEGRASRIPNFITAASPQGLRRLMLATNIKYGIEFHYYQIQFVGGKWYAWYQNEIDVQDELLKTENK